MRNPNNTLLAIIVSLAVVAVLIGGFMLAGSPQTARDQQIDMIRSNSLDQIAYALDASYQRDKKLPETLTPLITSPSDQTYFTDPVSLQPYSYTVKDASTYELCASFDQPSPENGQLLGHPPVIGHPDFYTHGIGQTCFTGTVSAPMPLPAVPQP